MYSNNTSTAPHDCRTYYTPLLHIHTEHLVVLKVLGIITFILNGTINSFATIMIIKTKQLKNPSVLIICYLSVSNCGLAFANFLLLILLYAENSSCTLEIAAQFFNTYFLHTAAFMILVTAYDRYLKIHHLHNYPKKMTTTKVSIFFAIISGLAFFQGVARTVETINPHIHLSGFILLPMNFVMLISTTVFYLKAIRAMKFIRRNSHNQDILKSVDGTVTKLSTFYLLSVFALYLPSLATSFLKHLYNLDVLHFVFFIGMLLIYVNPTVNGIVFIRLNRAIYRKVTSMARTVTDHTRNHVAATGARPTDDVENLATITRNNSKRPSAVAQCSILV